MRRNVTLTYSLAEGLKRASISVRAQEAKAEQEFLQHRWGSPSGEWIESMGLLRPQLAEFGAVLRDRHFSLKMSAVQDAMKLLDTPGLRERMRELNLVVNSPDIRATMENVARWVAS